MTQPAPEENDPEPKAEHGARSDVNWDDGQRSEPYTNQGGGEGAEPQAGEEFSEGDRGDLSGRNLEQLEAVKGTPP